MYIADLHCFILYFVPLITSPSLNKEFCIVLYCTASEVVGKGEVSSPQIIADKEAEWSLANRVQLNDEKCKELRISFARNKAIFKPIRVSRKELVDSAKLLGITLTSDLSWNTHAHDFIKKTAKRPLFSSAENDQGSLQ